MIGRSLLLVAILAAAAAAQGTRGPSTPEERAKALELVELLETRPTASEAGEAMTWLIAWLAAVPDITVHLCLAPLGSARELEAVPALLTVQPAFSQAGFAIRNPDAPSAGVETYLAGVEGALRAYRAMRAAGASGPLEPFEKLEAARREGTLERVVEKRSRKCR